EYNSDGGGYAAWEAVIQDDNIQDIFQYHQKIYAARGGENDEYDYAVVSREDEPGIILHIRISRL
ncbi:MAG: hypothetical protein Q4C66_06055, partial [Lachnospiraceae bacterium]|nr:hypothetical protein [Lachnospiraceae bacterium]